MGSLIRNVTSLAGAGYGINVLEQAAPRSVVGDLTQVVGMVAFLPWGPANTITTVTSAAEFFASFYPDAFASGTGKDQATYPAIKALLNKRLFPSGGLKVVRVEPSGAAAATLDFDDSGATESITVTANYKGLIGNQITVAWTANADTAGNRDARVTFGNYDKLYLNVITAAGVLTDPGDPYVTFSKHASYAGVPAAISATALASGADGTVAAADYTGAGKGISLFESASVDVDILFVAEPSDSLIDDLNTDLVAWATAKEGIAVLSTPDGQAPATAAAYVSSNSYESDRVIYPWPRVKTLDYFSTSPTAVEVDGASFVVAALANLEPWKSPGGAEGAPFLSGITSLEDETATLTTLATLNAGGVAPFFIDRDLGAILHKGVATNNTRANVAGTGTASKIVTRRMKDYILGALRSYAVYYTETVLDLDLSAQVLGPNTGALLGGFQAFMQALEDAKIIRDYSLDPFSENTQSTIDAGQWVIGIVVKLYSQADEIVLKHTIGETVTVQD